MATGLGIKVEFLLDSGVGNFELFQKAQKASLNDSSILSVEGG